MIPLSTWPSSLSRRRGKRSSNLSRQAICLSTSFIESQLRSIDQSDGHLSLHSLAAASYPIFILRSRELNTAFDRHYGTLFDDWRFNNVDYFVDYYPEMHMSVYCLIGVSWKSECTSWIVWNDIISQIHHNTPRSIASPSQINLFQYHFSTSI